MTIRHNPLRDWVPLDIPYRSYRRTFCGKLDQAFHKIFVPHVFGLIQGHAASHDSFVLPGHQRRKWDICYLKRQYRHSVAAPNLGALVADA